MNVQLLDTTKKTEFAPLPLLKTDRIPEAISAAPAFATIVKRYNEINEQARQLQEAYAVSLRKINEARTADVQAGADALIEGEKPGKSSETAAIEAATKAHAAASAATVASNNLRRQIIDMVKGETGSETFAHYNSEARSTARGINEDLDRVATSLRELAELQHTVKWIAEVREGRQRRSLPSAHVSKVLASDVALRIQALRDVCVVDEGAE